jgi:hypothetical protein
MLDIDSFNDFYLLETFSGVFELKHKSFLQAIFNRGKALADFGYCSFESCCCEGFGNGQSKKADS